MEKKISKTKKLEKQLQEQIEGTSQLVQDCDGWRDKYRKLIDENNKTKLSNKALHKTVVEKNHEIEELNKELEKTTTELRKLKNQTFSQFLKNKFRRE